MRYGASEDRNDAQVGFAVSKERMLKEALDEKGCHFRRDRVGTSKVIRGGSRLGIYFLENGAAQRGSKVIYDREGSSIATIKKGMVDWDGVFEDADWFHWTGITPAVSESLCEVCLEGIVKAKERGLTVSCELN